MQDIDIAALSRTVLWASFALAVIFGAIAQRTHFCTMGAVSDVVNVGDWSRMRMWALAIGVAMLGFNGMVALGWVQASNSIYAAPRVLEYFTVSSGGREVSFTLLPPPRPALPPMSTEPEDPPENAPMATASA